MTVSGPDLTPVPSSGDIRLVSYNVRYQGVDEEPYDWPQRKDRVLTELRRLSPDVIAFQEVWLDQLSDLKRGLPAYEWVTADDELPHTPIAYRSDRFELAESGDFWLSPPDAPAGQAGWDSTYQRRCTWATLTSQSGTVPVTIFSVHLDHEGDEARRKGVSQIRDRVSAVGGESVVAGDFNCSRDSPAFTHATASISDKRDLHDARRIAGDTGGPATTYVGFDDDTPTHNDVSNTQIDHILVTPKLNVSRVVTVVPEGESADVPPSDHRPILADFELS